MLELYRLPFSTNVERVALALAHKGLEVESVWVDPADRSPVQDLSGQPLVPVLNDSGHLVVDSTAILRYLEEHYPEPALYPREVARRTEIELYIDWFNHVCKRPPNELEAELGSEATTADRIAELREWMGRNLDLHEALLDGRDYLFGDVLTAADCAAFPFLKYALGRDPEDNELFHRILDEYQSVEARPRLADWIRRVDAHPRV